MKHEKGKGQYFRQKWTLWDEIRVIKDFGEKHPARDITSVKSLSGTGTEVFGDYQQDQ